MSFYFLRTSSRERRNAISNVKFEQPSFNVSSVEMENANDWRDELVAIEAASTQSERRDVRPTPAKTIVAVQPCGFLDTRRMRVIIMHPCPCSSPGLTSPRFSIFRGLASPRLEAATAATPRRCVRYARTWATRCRAQRAALAARIPWPVVSRGLGVFRDESPFSAENLTARFHATFPLEQVDRITRLSRRDATRRVRLHTLPSLHQPSRNTLLFCCLATERRVIAINVHVFVFRL